MSRKKNNSFLPSLPMWVKKLLCTNCLDAKDGNIGQLSHRNWGGVFICFVWNQRLFQNYDFISRSLTYLLCEQLLESFQSSFPSLSFPPLPERGDFNLRDVLESPYFFNWLRSAAFCKAWWFYFLGLAGNIWYVNLARTIDLSKVLVSEALINYNACIYLKGIQSPEDYCGIVIFTIEVNYLNTIVQNNKWTGSFWGFGSSQFLRILTMSTSEKDKFWVGSTHLVGPLFTYRDKHFEGNLTARNFSKGRLSIEECTASIHIWVAELWTKFCFYVAIPMTKALIAAIHHDKQRIVLIVLL